MYCLPFSPDIKEWASVNPSVFSLSSHRKTIGQAKQDLHSSFYNANFIHE